MKKLFTLLVMVFVCMSGYAQTFIDPQLREEMNRRNDDEQMTVIVIMKSQYDRTQLNRRANYFTTRAERREFVVNELKDFSAASQYDLRHSLAEMERNGMVTEPTILWMANALYFDATKAAIQDIARRNDIEIIGFAKEYNWIPESDAARQAVATREITQNVIKVGANQVWEQGYLGQGVVVAVIDTGVNYNHVDVADHLWDGGSEFPHHGYDVKNHDNDPMDDQGHGSHCSGTVLGDGTAGSQTGMAPEATLMCVKCLDNTGNGGAQNISEGIQWAVEHGCDMFSMSLGLPLSSIPDRTLLRHTCEAALDAGIVAAIAAGNEGNQTWMYPIPNNVRVPGSCPPPYMDDVQGENPGGLTCSVCVGAVDYNDAAAYFSSRGPVTWQNTEFGDYPYQPGIGLIRPDVCAPGVDIKSLNYESNTGYTYMSGTSMATPCVAGCMALMLSKDINLTPSDVCRILEETAVPLATGKSNTYGFGRVNVLAAVEAIQVGAIQYNYSYQIHDPEGNNNAVLNPGESVTLSAVMVNISSDPVSNVSVVLTTSDENVIVTQNTASCPDFAPNEALMLEDAFAFTVSDQVVAKQDIRFNLEVYVDGERTGTYGLVVTVYDDQLEYGTTTVLNDDNGNGLLNPGETADLRIFIDNMGNQLAEMVTGVLSSDYEFVTINETQGSFSTIGAELMGYADFNITLDAAAPDDFVIPFNLDLVDFNGKHTELTFNYQNTCNVIFSLHDANGNGWQDNYLTVIYSDGQPSDQMTIEEGSSVTFTRHLTSGSRIMLRWHNGQGASQCSFEVTYEDGTVIFENQGGFSGNKVFDINCTVGSSVSGFCEPIQGLTYELEGHDVVLSWEAPQNGTPAWYEVYRDTELLDLVEELTYTDPDVEEGLYNYCVYAAYDGCQSEYVCVEVDVSMCGAVQNLGYTLNDDLLLTLTWEAPEDPTGLVEYQVYMDDEQLNATNELTYAFTVTEGEHDIVVKAVYEACEKDAHVDVCAVGAVENLTYEKVGNGVIFRWDDLEGVSQYEVYFDGELKATVDRAIYLQSSMVEGVTIVTVKPVVEDCFSAGASVEVCMLHYVEPVYYFKLDWNDQMSIVWNPDSDIDYYEVEFNGVTTQLSETSFVCNPDLGVNEFCLTAYAVYGCASDPTCRHINICSEEINFDYAFNGSEVTITWEAEEEIYQNRIKINEDEYVVFENSFTTQLENGTYSIDVKPSYTYYSEWCHDSFTAHFEFVVNNIAPEIRFTDVHDGVMATSWNAVEGAIAYNLYRDGELIAENLTTTTYNDTEMALNARHCYAVQSVFEKGISDKSEEVCANYFAGVDENDSKVNIFPNPTTDKITIECTGMTLIEVYSEEGRMVDRIRVDGDTYQLIGLEKGIYTLRISRGEEVLVRRVVKM